MFCLKTSHTNVCNVSNTLRMNPVAYVKQYTIPILRENDPEWYVEFYCYDPEGGKLRRKKIKVNRIKKTIDRRRYAREVIKRLIVRLGEGWNPWIEQRAGGSLKTWMEVVDTYSKYIYKMLNDGAYRPDTFSGYKSYLKNVVDYNLTRPIPITYIYQFDRRFIIDVLEYIHIERDNSAQTRNNYLMWLRLFSSFCYEKGFLNVKATDGIKEINKRLIRKERTDIPLDVVKKIGNYLMEHDRHFLLACQLLYYCCIRPTELSRMKLSAFNLKAGTITIKGEDSKNRKSQTVTLPKKVLHYAIELGIFNNPSSYYIFSNDLKPGTVQRDGKIFRDNWAKLKKPLGLKPQWKFYSLKDTGITEMLDKHLSNISVRDQARHSDLAVTDVYTRKANLTADPSIQDLVGSL